MRSFCSTCFITFQPCPSGPSMSASETSTLVKNTSWKDCAPDTPGITLATTPGVFIGTMNTEMVRLVSPVRASRKQ